jgi:phenylacetate-CoA ligase
MLPLIPGSLEDIRRIQSERKVVAVERARQAPFFAGKLDHIDKRRLDDPEEWRKIPIMTKDQLRALGPAEFQQQFCIAPKHEIAEYWRSGGVTGEPLFYPRTFADMRVSLLAFGRAWPSIGCRPGDLAHISFPLGIHPAGQVWARSALDRGVGMIWVGPGSAVPSVQQLRLLDTLKPTIWLGMSSYGLHLANVAEAEGFDLAGSSVEKVVVSAEPLSASKRAKLARHWGAQVYDVFGMSEAGLMGAEDESRDGYRIWTDMYWIEVVDAEGRPVKPGEAGSLIVTPLWSNHATPFLRWASGDIVTYEERSGSGPFALFPVIRHSHRTAGFFKIRGINLNHAELEDFMFAEIAVADFQAEAIAAAEGLEHLRVSVELVRGAVAEAVLTRLGGEIAQRFAIKPHLVVLASGTLAKTFEASVKAPRFVDRRG